MKILIKNCQQKFFNLSLKIGFCFHYSRRCGYLIFDASQCDWNNSGSNLIRISQEAFQIIAENLIWKPLSDRSLQIWNGIYKQNQIWLLEPKKYQKCFLQWRPSLELSWCRSSTCYINSSERINSEDFPFSNTIP